MLFDGLWWSPRGHRRRAPQPGATSDVIITVNSYRCDPEHRAQADDLMARYGYDSDNVQEIRISTDEIGFTLFDRCTRTQRNVVPPRCADHHLVENSATSTPRTMARARM